MPQTYFAILVTQHITVIPPGLEEPHGVFSSLTEIRQYIGEQAALWSARTGHYPYFGTTLRVAEYATKEQAKRADISDDTGHNPPIRWVRENFA
jgi:hypothetical protein